MAATMMTTPRLGDNATPLGDNDTKLGTCSAATGANDGTLG